MWQRALKRRYVWPLHMHWLKTAKPWLSVVVSQIDYIVRLDKMLANHESNTIVNNAFKLQILPTNAPFLIPLRGLRTIDVWDEIAEGSEKFECDVLKLL